MFVLFLECVVVVLYVLDDGADVVVIMVGDFFG